MDVRVGLWRRLSAEEVMLLNCGVGEDSWEPLGLQGYPTSPFWRRSTLGFLWKEWCLSWNSSTSATSCEELTHWKRLWCWEGLGAGGEGDDRRWAGWMASLLDGRESEWTPGVGDRQGGLACCDSWGRKEPDTTAPLNWTDAVLLFTASDLASITSHIHSWVLFLLSLHPFILSRVISPLISSSVLGTYWPGEFLFSILSFCLFILFMGFSRQEYWSGLPFLSPVDHILSIIFMKYFLTKYPLKSYCWA